ncbi:MAG: carotenoid biosynthesis protein [Candidatus Thorarchaeota archaeon]
MSEETRIFENRSTLLSIVFLILMMAVSLPVFLNPPLQVKIMLLTLYVVMVFAFSLTGRGISIFFGIAVLVTYVMEWIGTHFGVPFGYYYYTNQLGPLLMDVPIVIPLQWFNILYVCYIMTNIMLNKGDIVVSDSESGVPNLSDSIPRFLASSVVVGLCMVSWDFINDPYMVGIGSWVWTNPTEFFGLTFHGIPLSNFLGWILTSALTILLFELYRYRKRIPIRRSADTGSKPLYSLVLVPYLYLFVFQAANGIVAGVFTFGSIMEWMPIVLAMVSMGLAASVTGWRYLQNRSS